MKHILKEYVGFIEILWMSLKSSGNIFFMRMERFFFFKYLRMKRERNKEQILDKEKQQKRDKSIKKYDIDVHPEYPWL